MHYYLSSSKYFAKLVTVLSSRIGRRLDGAHRDRNIKAVVVLHPAGVGPAIQWKRRRTFTLHVIATDFVLHAFQCQSEVDFVFAAKQIIASGDDARRRQIGSNYIEAGIPVDISPSTKTRRTSATDGRPFILVSFGAKGIAHQNSIKYIADKLALLDVNVHFLCGMNKDFSRYIRHNYKEEITKRKFSVHGFEKDVSYLYRISDIFIGKAGGISISEAIAAGIDIIVTECLPGQEEVNLNYLLQRGLGVDGRGAAKFEREIENALFRIESRKSERVLPFFTEQLSAVEIIAREIVRKIPECIITASPGLPSAGADAKPRLRRQRV